MHAQAISDAHKAKNMRFQPFSNNVFIYMFKRFLKNSGRFESFSGLLQGHLHNRNGEPDQS